MCMGGFGMVVGFTHRVMHVVERMQQAQAEVEATQGQIALSPDKIAFDNVTVAIPSKDKDARVLVRNLSMAIPGSVCAAGHGKSSIVRVLAGMWPVSGGKVSRPAWGSDGIYFVPQANYASQGTLAAQVVYPLLLADVRPTNAQLTSILNEVGLGAIVRRWGLHKVVNWDMVLSGGECQRLGFARVLFHMPRFAVLDETTSALDMATEERCMGALTKRNISLLSFAARPSVAAYHETMLEVSPSGLCSLTPVEGGRAGRGGAAQARSV